MSDEYEKYRKPDGNIDWGEYARAKHEADIAEPEKKIIELEDLRVFKLADELSDFIWDVVIRWDYFEKKTLGDQWVRATDSVAANIAEGYGRYYFGEYVVFLYYSRGSLMETVFWTEKARRRKLLREEEYKWIKARLEVLPKELNAMIKNVKNQEKNWGRRRATGS